MAQMRIDQVGLPEGIPGKARTDGLLNGAKVRLTSLGSGPALFRFQWVPPGASGAVSSLAPITAGSKIWEFDPAVGLPGTYLIECIESVGTALESREVRAFRVRTANHGLIIPALNEIADPRASLFLSGEAQVKASQDNAIDYPQTVLNSFAYAGWWRALHEWIMALDNLVGGAPAVPIDWKESARTLATTNATLSGLAQTISGVALDTDGYRVVLTGQSNAIENGIWVVHSGAWTRSADLAAASHAANAACFIEQGTHADTAWVCSTDAPGDVVGTNALVWVKFTGANTTNAANVGAGAGLFRDKTGDVLNFRSVLGIGGVTAAVNGNVVEVNADNLMLAAGVTGLDGVDASVASQTLTVRASRDLINPASVSVQQNNYAPASLNTADIVTQAATVDVVFSGLTAPNATGTRLKVWKNSSLEAVETLAHEHAASSAANRFACPRNTDLVLQPGEAAMLLYFGSRYHVIATTGSGTSAPAASGREGLFALRNRMQKVSGTASASWTDDASLKGYQRLLFVPQWEQWLQFGFNAAGHLAWLRMRQNGDVISSGEWSAEAFLSLSTNRGPITCCAIPLAGTHRAIVGYGNENATTFHIRTSDDCGQNWVSRQVNTVTTLGPTVNIWTGQNVVLAFDSSEIETSVDGATWVNRTPPDAGTRALPVHNGNGVVLLFRTGSTNSYARSDDHGVTWATETFAAPHIVDASAYKGGLFYVKTADQEILTSEDGLTWSAPISMVVSDPGPAVTMVADPDTADRSISWMVTLGDYLVVPMQSDDGGTVFQDLYVSQDGITWTTHGTLKSFFGETNAKHIAVGDLQLGVLDWQGNTWLSLRDIPGGFAAGGTANVELPFYVIDSPEDLPDPNMSGERVIVNDGLYFFRGMVSGEGVDPGDATVIRLPDTTIADFIAADGASGWKSNSALPSMRIDAPGRYHKPFRVDSSGAGPALYTPAVFSAFDNWTIVGDMKVHGTMFFTGGQVRDVDWVEGSEVFFSNTTIRQVIATNTTPLAHWGLWCTNVFQPFGSTQIFCEIQDGINLVTGVHLNEVIARSSALLRLGDGINGGGQRPWISVQNCSGGTITADVIPAGGMSIRGNNLGGFVGFHHLTPGVFIRECFDRATGFNFPETPIAYARNGPTQGAVSPIHHTYTVPALMQGGPFPAKCGLLIRAWAIKTDAIEGFGAPSWFANGVVKVDGSVATDVSVDQYAGSLTIVAAIVGGAVRLTFAPGADPVVLKTGIEVVEVVLPPV